MIWPPPTTCTTFKTPYPHGPESVRSIYSLFYLCTYLHARISNYSGFKHLGTRLNLLLNAFAPSSTADFLAIEDWVLFYSYPGGVLCHRLRRHTQTHQGPHDQTRRPQGMRLLGMSVPPARLAILRLCITLRNTLLHLIIIVNKVLRKQTHSSISLVRYYLDIIWPPCCLQERC